MESRGKNGGGRLNTHCLFLLDTFFKCRGTGRDKEACQNMCGCSNSVQTKQACLAEVLNETMRVIHMHHFTVPRR